MAQVSDPLFFSAVGQQFHYAGAPSRRAASATLTPSPPCLCICCNVDGRSYKATMRPSPTSPPPRVDMSERARRVWADAVRYGVFEREDRRPLHPEGASRRRSRVTRGRRASPSPSRPRPAGGLRTQPFHAPADFPWLQVTTMRLELKLESD
jgi:hypothetical protein